LSLVVALSFSTLAAADSVPAGLTFFHSGVEVTGAVNTAKATSAIFASGDQDLAVANTHIDRSLSGSILLDKSTATSATKGMTVVGNVHDNLRFRTSGWDGMGRGHTMSTPEPGSLMLLSTGLIGIAGMTRRKLVRG
jgi:hypothetical protein